MKNYIKVVSIVFLAALLVPSIASALCPYEPADCFDLYGRNLNHNQGKYEEAIQCYDIAIMLNPNFGQAYYDKALALKALGRITEADAAFAKAKDLGYTG